MDVGEAQVSVANNIEGQPNCTTMNHLISNNKTVNSGYNNIVIQCPGIGVGPEQRIYMSSPNEPSGPGRPNLSIPLRSIAGAIQQDNNQKMQQKVFYNYSEKYQNVHNFDPNKNVRAAYFPNINSAVPNGLRPQTYENQAAMNNISKVYVRTSWFGLLSLSSFFPEAIERI